MSEAFSFTHLQFFLIYYMHMFEGEEKADRIDELDKRLYSRSENALPPRRHGILHQLPHKVDSTWKNTDQMKAKVKNTALSISVFKKFARCRIRHIQILRRGQYRLDRQYRHQCARQRICFRRRRTSIAG